MEDYALIRKPDGRITGIWLKDLATAYDPIQLCFLFSISKKFVIDQETKNIYEKIKNGKYHVAPNDLNNNGGAIVWLDATTNKKYNLIDKIKKITKRWNK